MSSKKRTKKENKKAKDSKNEKVDNGKEIDDQDEKVVNGKIFKGDEEMDNENLENEQGENIKKRKSVDDNQEMDEQDEKVKKRKSVENDDEKVDEQNEKIKKRKGKSVEKDDEKVKRKSVVNDDEKMDTADKNVEITKKEDLTPYFEKRDHSVNQVHQSEVPQICKDEPCQLGVDEAGRGPVLGPMVYGIAYAPLSQKKLLVDMGCADSKTLTEEKRDAIFDKICDNSEKMGYAVDCISPNYIANCMYRRCKTSLNEVSMNAAIGLIKKTLEAGVFVTEIYVDTVGPPEKYRAKLEVIFPGIKITVAKKADSTYPIVSAASICAKVSRDHALRAWQFREAENETEYGSGYPNDPATKKWLADGVDPIFGFPQLVRFSWSTAEKILESKAVAVEWEDPEEDSPSSEVKISNYFAPSPAKKSQSQRARHNFFTNRCLSSATAL